MLSELNLLLVQEGISIYLLVLSNQTSLILRVVLKPCVLLLKLVLITGLVLHPAHEIPFTFEMRESIIVRLRRRPSLLRVFFSDSAGLRGEEVTGLLSTGLAAGAASASGSAEAPPGQQGMNTGQLSQMVLSN